MIQTLFSEVKVDLIHHVMRLCLNLKELVLENRKSTFAPKDMNQVIGMTG